MACRLNGPRETSHQEASMTTANRVNPKKESNEDLFLVFNFSYDEDIVVPWEEGIKLLESLKNSIILKGYKAKKKLPFYTDLRIKVMSRQELKLLDLENAISPEN